MDFAENKQQGAKCQAARGGGGECGNKATYVFTGLGDVKIGLCGVHAKSYRGNPNLVEIGGSQPVDNKNTPRGELFA